jgi:hypothetical protein
MLKAKKQKRKNKKKQEKIIEDKTFCLKNKNKSKAVQSYIKGMESAVKNKGQEGQALQGISR